MKPLLRALFSLSMLFSFVAISWAAKSIAEYKFRGVPDGSQPNGGLVADRAGNFYGTTSGGGHSQCGLSTPFCGTVFKLSQGATGQWEETILYEFTGGADGGGPSGSLVFDKAGNLYGTAISGGNSEPAMEWVVALSSNSPQTKMVLGLTPPFTISSAAPMRNSRAPG